MNKKLSRFFALLAFVFLLAGMGFTVGTWFGFIETTISPLEIFKNALDKELLVGEIKREGFNLFFYGFLSGCSWLVVFAGLIGFCRSYSRRYLFDSWDAMKLSDKNDHDNRIIYCGEIVDVDLDEGGTTASSFVTIKTTESIYRCAGRISQVDKGSKVRKQNNELIIIDSGSEKRLSLV